MVKIAITGKRREAVRKKGNDGSFHEREIFLLKPGMQKHGKGAKIN